MKNYNMLPSLLVCYVATIQDVSWWVYQIYDHSITTKETPTIVLMVTKDFVGKSSDHRLNKTPLTDYAAYIFLRKFSKVRSKIELQSYIVRFQNYKTF